MRGLSKGLAKYLNSTAIKHVTDPKKMEDAPNEKGIIGSNIDF